MAVEDAGKYQEPAKVAMLNNPVVRSWIFQVTLVVFLIWSFYTMWTNLNINRAARKIKTGFDFLSNDAGFAISFSPFIDYNEASSYFDSYLVGLQNTLFLAVIGIFFATLLGFLIGIARLSNNWVVAKISYAYVETLRNIPLLLQMFIWYKLFLDVVPPRRESVDLGEGFYLNNSGLTMPKPNFEAGSQWMFYALLLALAVSFVIGSWAKKRQVATGQRFPVFWTSVGLIIGLPLLAYFIMGQPLTFENAVAGRFGPKGGARLGPELLAMVLALSFYTAAFIAEIVRAGIMAVNKGQTEASYALGLTRSQTLRLNIIPQAMRVIIPPLTSQYLNLTKNTSLGSAIAYQDLTAAFAGTALNQAGQAVEIMAMTMATYLTVSLLTSMFMNWFNARMALVER